MANSSVIRILKLYKLLRQETNEQHPLLATTVCQRLVEQGIPCDRRTLTRNARTLNDYGYEVMDRLVGHEKAYADIKSQLVELLAKLAALISEKKHMFGGGYAFF